MDRLTVSGIGKRVDGVYDCDLTALLVDVTSPTALRVSEAEQIRRLSGARGYEMAEQFLAGDWTVRMAIAMVVLARNDVQMTERQGWDATVGSFVFDLDVTVDDQAADDAGDPTMEGLAPSENGGGSGNQTSAPNQDSQPIPIGRHESAA